MHFSMCANPHCARCSRTLKAPSDNTRCAIGRCRWDGPSSVFTSSTSTWGCRVPAQDRDGFQRLVSEVANGHAGIVLGLEVSRLARNNADWHRLLELSALTQTLILDEDGVYDPAHFNDRLLLGLKGAMSEAELHVLKARLQGGMRNKARRGELEIPLPVGLVYHPDRTVVLDPDQAIRAALQLLFDTFRQTKSATATVKRFRREGWLFPRRIRRGIGKGDVLWGPLEHCRTVQVLHNPRYAGAFAYGRTRTAHRGIHKQTQLKVAREDWLVLIRDAHPGYLGWEEFEGNQATLKQNADGFGAGSRGRMPREGVALLQGRVVRHLRRTHASTLSGSGRQTCTVLRLHRELGPPRRQTVPVGTRA